MLNENQSVAMSDTIINRPKTYAEIAKEIVKGSIRSAICIDDLFQGPYMSAEEIEIRKEELSAREGRDIKLEFDIPREIYGSFRKMGHCDIDIYNFRNLTDSWHPNLMLSNKDLMIIDWELDGPDGYSSTLQILKETISANSQHPIPFIIIYTAKPEADFELIAGRILEQFNPFDRPKEEMVSLFGQHFAANFKGLSEEIVESDLVGDFLFESTQNLYEYWRHVKNTARDAVKRDIYQRIMATFQIDPDKELWVPKALHNTMEATFGKSKEPLELLYYLSLNGVSDDLCTIRRIDSDNLGFKIRESTVCIFSKPGLGKESKVEPEDVLDAFSNLIVRDPHNFLTLLGLEMRGRLSKHLLKITEKVSGLDERAFFLHLAGYEQRSGNFKNEFFDFLIKNWTNEIEACNINQTPQVFDALDEYRNERKLNLAEIKQEEIYNELGQLAASLSTINIENRAIKDPKIRFGDIFKVNGTGSEVYFMCVTPQCVCVDPGKVENNFYFIKSKEIRTDLKLALGKIESGYYSLIKRDSGEIISIDWAECKPFTIWIGDNNLQKLVSRYGSHDISLTYCTTLKENFAQRLANKAFNYGTSVGIDLPHLINVK